MKSYESTHNILFEVNLTENDSMIIIKSAPFFIDRTKWGILYKSKKILADLKNGYIKDEMEIIIDLYIKK